MKLTFRHIHSYSSAKKKNDPLTTSFHQQETITETFFYKIKPQYIWWNNYMCASFKGYCSFKATYKHICSHYAALTPPSFGSAVRILGFQTSKLTKVKIQNASRSGSSFLLSRDWRWCLRRERFGAAWQAPCLTCSCWCWRSWKSTKLIKTDLKPEHLLMTILLLIYSFISTLHSL